MCLTATVIGKKVSRQLSSGFTESITEGGIYIESLSATKAAANKKMTDTLSHLLSAQCRYMLPICGEYKLQLYCNYIVSLLQFHLSVDAITKCAITNKLPLFTDLKKWLRLPRSASYSCYILLSWCLLPKHFTGVMRSKIESLILCQLCNRGSPAIGLIAISGG